MTQPSPISGMAAAGVADGPALDIAVVGSGISGLSAAWLLSRKHRVTLFEADGRPGGHSNTVDVGYPSEDAGGRHIAVDTGFIVYNESAYPNLSAMFRHLGVATTPSEMSFAVSLDNGALEYSGTDLRGLFAQPRNLFSARFWSMLKDLMRFYKQAPIDAQTMGAMSLGCYLDAKGFGAAFRDDHLYPMAAAIWSTPAARVGEYPMQSFVRFCENHHLLKLSGRPAWRTVVGGSRCYVERLTGELRANGGLVRVDSPVIDVKRDSTGVSLLTRDGVAPERFDHVVMATHADQTLRILHAPDPAETRLLGAFGYSRNHAVLHSDPALMPRRRAVWSSWNYAADRRASGQPAATAQSSVEGGLCVTYWMNRLQSIPDETPLFLTLNPTVAPRPEHLIRTEVYEHPMFNADAMAAQNELWALQGVRRTWFCGAYFGSGFHEDGLQSGLAVAEAIGGVRRPWTVANESGRIVLGPVATPALASSLS